MNEEVLTTSRAAELKAEAALNLATEQTDKVTELLAKLTDRADDLDKRFVSIDARSENVRSQLELSMTQLEIRLAGIVEQLPSGQPTIAALSRESEDTLDRFKNNSGFEINFYVYGSTPVPIRKQLIAHFREQGFKVVDGLDPDIEGAPNEIDIATVSYTSMGEEKLDFVVAQLRGVGNCCYINFIFASKASRSSMI